LRSPHPAAIAIASTCALSSSSRAWYAAVNLHPHHLRFAQPRALGRKASDEFTVPLCRVHHREVHRAGDWTLDLDLIGTGGRSSMR
jgi:hypothetical protein